MKKLILICAACSLITFAACQKECQCPAQAPCENAAAQEAAKPAEDAPKPAAEAAKPEMTKTAIEVGGEEIVLPKPIPETKSLTECLQARRSVRTYTDEMISLEQLSGVLWSGNGINREDGKRTAPSAMNKQSVNIYVTFEKGAYKYDHKDHKLVRLSEEDVRPLKAAPVELLLTSNLVSDKPVPKSQKKPSTDDAAQALDFALMRGIDSGTVSENIALYCAAQNIATVIRMQRVVTDGLKNALKLPDNEYPLFNMALGFEK